MGRWALAILAAATVWGQPDTEPAFEAVSIKRSTPQTPGSGGGMGCRGGPGSNDPGRITCLHTGLFLLIMRTYDVPYYRISGLQAGGQPEFQIDIKVPAGATREQIGPMWRKVLAERFGLAVHWEKKEMAGYDLVAAKGGVKIRVSDGGDPIPLSMPMRGPVTDEYLWAQAAAYPGHEVFGLGKARFVARDSAIEELRSALDRELQRPVVDASGLTGKYSFRFWWSPMAADDGEAGPTIFAALEGQLGLKLEARKVLVDLLVVDHAERLPTQN